MDITGIMTYGTLKTGMRNHAHFCYDAVSIQPATVNGILYDLPYGYPAMFDSDDASNIVHGELITFPDIAVALRRLDRLEGYNPASPDSSLYLRIVKPVTITATGKVVRAYVYVFHPCKLPEVKRIGKLVESGIW